MEDRVQVDKSLACLGNGGESVDVAVFESGLRNRDGPRQQKPRKYREAVVDRASMDRRRPTDPVPFAILLLDR